jgi:hypothetical protein
MRPEPEHQRFCVDAITATWRCSAGNWRLRLDCFVAIGQCLCLAATVVRFLFLKGEFMRFSIHKLLIVCIGLCFATPVFADHGNDLMIKSKKLKMEANSLREQGHPEEAERLMRQSNELRAEANRFVEQQQQEVKREIDGAARDQKQGHVDSDIPHLKEQLQDLMNAQRASEERNEPEEARVQRGKKIRHLEETLARFAKEPGSKPFEVPPQFRERAEKLEVAFRRLEHMRVAAENLKAAEMHDMAHEVMERSETMGRELGEAKQALANAIRESMQYRENGSTRELLELREENERLRNEMRELLELQKRRES